MKIIAIDPGNELSAYCLYKHTNLINSKIYIGITCQKPNNRWRKGNGYKECPCFYNAIKKYGWDNFKHEILLDELTKEEAEQKEIELIKKYKSNNHKYGYNIANGGNYSGRMSQETKNKISKSLKGRKFTNEHKNKISESQKGYKNHMYGKHLSQETKDKISKGNLINPSSGCFKSQKISQYTIQGEYIKTWDSMGQIYRELGIKHCCISDCCRGKQKTSGGYIWKYCQ